MILILFFFIERASFLEPLSLGTPLEKHRISFINNLTLDMFNAISSSDPRLAIILPQLGS